MNQVKPTDDTSDLDPDDAHEVLVDVTGGNETGPPKAGDSPHPADSDHDPADTGHSTHDLAAANGETVPKSPDDVSESQQTAERLEGHGSEPSPPPVDHSSEP